MQNPSTDEEIPAMPWLGGERREANPSCSGGEEQAKRAEEPEALGAAALPDELGRDRENASAALRTVRRDGKRARVQLRGAWRIRRDNDPRDVRQGFGLRYVEEEVAVDPSLSIQCRHHDRRR